MVGAQALGAWASVVAACRLSSRGLWAPEDRIRSCGACALVAPWHVESSRTSNLTYAPYIGGWILILCTTREVQELIIFK